MTKQASSVLNDLIETLKDGEQGFRAAAEDATRSDLKQVFMNYSTQRAQFAQTLQAWVERLGEEPEESGSVAGALHRGWLNLKSAVTGRDDHAILEECERGEDAAVKAYQDALQENRLGSARMVVEQQLDQIRSAHDHVRMLRDSVRTTV